MRYFLCSKLSTLFDQEILERSWRARIELNDQVSEAELANICRVLRERSVTITDLRARELIVGGLQWAENHPARIQYNAEGKENVLQISPNLVGFQFVMQGMAQRTENARATARKIVVDQQNQFNNAQQFLAAQYKLFRSVDFKTGPGMPELDFSGMPDIPLTFTSGTQSCGLEIVDTLLWIAKRADEGRALTPELNDLMRFQSLRGRQDELSFAGLKRRWMPWLQGLPTPTAEAEERAREHIRLEDERRLAALR